MGTLNIPGKLAIYYGWPSIVNGSAGNISAAVAAFNAYDIVVFGNGLQDPTHGDHAKTVSIIQNLNALPHKTVVYGYIPIGVSTGNLSLQEINLRIDAWSAMGVTGIFLDEAGYDFGVGRQRQNDAVDYTHGKSLGVFINAFNPDDVFSPAVDTTHNPNGLASHLGGNDVYLYESFQITFDHNTCAQRYEDSAPWASKSDKAQGYKTQFGTRIATVTRVAGEYPQFDQSKFNYAWWSTLLYGFDFTSWGEADFSPGSQLPFHKRPNPGYLGVDFMSPVIHSSSNPSVPVPDLHRRVAPGGTIEVDTAHYTAGISTVAYWRFEEGAGTVANDSTGKGNNGVISGATYAAPVPALPKVNSTFALLFHAKGNYVTIPAGPGTNLNSFPSGITLEAFIKPAQLPIPPDTNGQRIKYIIWADDDIYSLRLVSDAAGNTLLVGVVNALKGNTGPCSVYSSASFNRNLAGVFSHVALTYGSKLLRLYLNGVLVKEVAAPPNCTSTVGPVEPRNLVRIGSDETADMPNLDRDFRGMIDEVRISGRALVPAEFLPR